MCTIVVSIGQTKPLYLSHPLLILSPFLFGNAKTHANTLPKKGGISSRPILYCKIEQCGKYLDLKTLDTSESGAVSILHACLAKSKVKKFKNLSISYYPLLFVCTFFPKQLVSLFPVSSTRNFG